MNHPNQRDPRDPEEPRDVLIARVTRVFGTRGEVGLKSFTDYPERFEAGQWLYIDCGGQKPYEIEKSHPSGADFFRVKLKGVENRGQASLLTRCAVYIRDSDRRREEGGVYPDEILGFTVQNPEGVPLGTVVDSEAGLVCSFFTIQPIAAQAPGKKALPLQVPLMQGGFVQSIDRVKRILVLGAPTLESLFEEDPRDTGD